MLLCCVVLCCVVLCCVVLCCVVLCCVVLCCVVLCCVVLLDNAKSIQQTTLAVIGVAASESKFAFSLSLSVWTVVGII